MTLTKLAFQVLTSKFCRILKVQELLHKLFTITLVIGWFTFFEGIPLSQRLVQNEKALIIFLVWQYVHSLPPFTKKYPTEKLQQALQYITIGFFVTTALIALVWPFAAWFNYEFTKLDTDYWTVRYFYYLLYIVTSNVRIPSLDSCQLLFCDGFILSQITSMLLYNELSLSCCLFCLSPWLLIQNSKIALDLMMYEKEPGAKSTFVRLIGAHDSIFVILVYSAMIAFTSVVDSIAYGKEHLLNLIYLPFCLYLFNRLMDEKADKLAKSWLPLIVIFMTIVSLAIYLLTQLKTKQNLPVT